MLFFALAAAAAFRAAAAAASAPPGPDVRSAAGRLAPAGARIVLAQELTWDRAVATWTVGGEPTAVPFVWRARRWRRAAGDGVTIAFSRTRIRGRQVSETVHITMRHRLLEDGAWVDGRWLNQLFLADTPHGETAFVDATLRPGRHVLTVYASVLGAAVAKAIAFSVR